MEKREIFISFFKNFWIYILIFVLAFGYRCLALSHKDFLFGDSMYSFSCSTPTNTTTDGKQIKVYYGTYKFDKEKNYTSKEVKRVLYEAKSGIKSIWADLKAMRNANIDKSHTNFYYSIFRIWNAGFDGLDYKEMIVRGVSLNLIFFTFSFFFLYKLLSLIKDDKRFISLGLFFSFICSASISNTMLIREYALSETCLILFLYVSMVFYKKIQLYDEDIPIPKCALYSVPFAMLALTGYLIAIFEFMVVAALLCSCIYHKRKILTEKLILICMFALGLVLLFYPHYFTWGLNNEQIAPMHQTVYNLVEHKVAWSKIIMKFYKFLGLFLFSPIFILVFFSLYPIAVDDKKEDYNKSEKAILYFGMFTVIYWTFFIWFITPHMLHFYPERYIMPAAFLFALLPVLLMYKFKRGFLYFTCALYALINLTLIQYPKAPDALGRLEYVYNAKRVVPPTKYMYLPWVVNNTVYSSWAMGNYYVYFTNHNTVRFDSDVDHKKIEFKKYLYLTNNQDKQPENSKKLLSYAKTVLYLVENQ